MHGWACRPARTLTCMHDKVDILTSIITVPSSVECKTSQAGRRGTRRQSEFTVDAAPVHAPPAFGTRADLSHAETASACRPPRRSPHRSPSRRAGWLRAAAQATRPCAWTLPALRLSRLSRALASPESDGASAARDSNGCQVRPCIDHACMHGGSTVPARRRCMH